MFVKKTIDSLNVTVNELKEQLNIDPSETVEDDLLNSYINAAAGFISGLIGADVGLTLNTVRLSSFNKELIINDAPFISLTSVKDSSGNDLTENFEAEENFEFFKLKSGGTYEKITVIYRTGFEILPPEIKTAILIKAGDLYDPERNSFITGVSAINTNVIPGLIAKHKRKYY